MKRLTLAFLYNVRHQYPDPDRPETQVETDFDDPETIEAMTAHLLGCGFDVIPIEADPDAYATLYAQRRDIDLVFNYAMGLYGRARYAQVPAMLEMLQLPYTGSDPLTQALILDKARMQQVLSACNVPVLCSQVFETGDEPLQRGLTFPLIVKPVAQGSSAGITADSVVRDEAALYRQAGRVIATFGEPALVQPFLEGREFSIPMMGNPPDIFPIIEPDFSRLPQEYARIDSLEVKWIFEEQTESHHLLCPAPVEPALKDRLGKTVLAAWKALGIRDWCRIDLRCDSLGNPYIIDVNSPPGMIPPERSMTSYFPMSARAAGIDYQGLLTKLIQTAMDRWTRQ
ncbi:MAG: D-alanine--D-alanine ligase family protein [Thermodesulfobacteriota bacterium]